MKLNHLRHVIAIAERGSLRSAARHLGLAQPALSRSIRELEHELGAVLFERRPGGMLLTPAGALFVGRARGIHRDLERAREEVEQLRHATTGTVSAALSTAAHVALLPRVVRPFGGRYPGVRINIVESQFPTIEAELREGRLDFYIGPLGEDATPSELLVETLFANERIIVGRVGNPFAGARMLGDLAAAEWVATAVMLDTSLELGPLFASHGLPAPRVAAQAETALSMITIAASSDLLAMMPRQWQPVFEALPILRAISVREPLAAPAICAVTRAHMPLTPAAQHLVDLFRRAADHHVRQLAKAVPDAAASVFS